MTCEGYLRGVIRGERGCGLLKGFLTLLSWLYRGVVILRHHAYDRGWLRQVEVPAVVVSVGNIVAGGTGKTPLVHLLVSVLMHRRRCAILSRGYRSSVEKSGEIMHLSKEKLPSLSPVLCGDEPYWLAQSLPEAAVFVGRERSRSALLACREGAEVLILDDGMQHRRLKRDFELVVVDATDPFGGGYFLPRAFLRDLPERLMSAHLIIGTAIENFLEYEQFQVKMAPYSAAPIVAMQLTACGDQDLKGKRVGLFCGIGNPGRFIESVHRLGGEIVESLVGRDHEAFPEEMLETFAKRCALRGAEALVCTEKDGVRVRSAFSPSLPIIPIKARFEVTFGADHWNTLLRKL
jgi:tetraacyldisaccharide 4'-kinase